MADVVEKFIRLATFEPFIITRAEYDEIRRDVVARRIANCTELGDRVLARLLLEHEYRYLEIG